MTRFGVSERAGLSCFSGILRIMRPCFVTGCFFVVALFFAGFFGAVGDMLRKEIGETLTLRGEGSDGGVSECGGLAEIGRRDRLDHPLARGVPECAAGVVGVTLRSGL